MVMETETCAATGFLGTSAILLSLLTSVFAALFSLIVYHHDAILKRLSPLPSLNSAFPYEDHVWTLDSSSKSRKDESEIVTWKLQVPQTDLDDLKERLRKTRFATPMKGQNFQYGFPGDQLKKVVDYWLNDFNWKKQEELINQYNHFKTVIEGLNIHFVHVRPAQLESAKGTGTVRVLPIILLHGWPGSFFELYKLVPLLTTPRLISGSDYIVFEVVIPSLPGYGFSEPSQKPGLSPPHIARIFKKLMERLKFHKFYIHGGDWGAAVGQSLGIMYPEHVTGLSLTMFPVVPLGLQALKSFFAKLAPQWIFKAEEPNKLLTSIFFPLIRETGYFHIQATKPDTVGAALLNDPAGLAAYILEKFSTWTNQENIKKPDGGLTEYFTLDDLLTNVMIYWTSASIVTSQRLYKDAFSEQRVQGFPVLVPSLLSDFKNEMPGINPPNAWVKPYFKDLIQIHQYSTGGHFPSMERPKDVAEDIWTLAKTVTLRKR